MTRIREVCGVDPGKLDKQLEVWQRAEKTGSQGQPVKERFKVAEFWGYIQTLSGTELERINRKWATCSHRIHANWSPQFENIHPVDQLRFGQRNFEILHVENVDFQNVKVEILVQEIVARKKR